MTVVDGSAGPVGVWSGVVRFDQQEEQFTISFAADGSITLRTPISNGEGEWVWVGPKRFTYNLKETFSAEAPMAGWVDIAVDASVEGVTYSGVGTAKIHNEAGDVVHATSATFSADRQAGVPVDLR